MNLFLSKIKETVVLFCQNGCLNLVHRKINFYNIIVDVQYFVPILKQSHPAFGASVRGVTHKQYNLLVVFPEIGYDAENRVSYLWVHSISTSRTFAENKIIDHTRFYWDPVEIGDVFNPFVGYETILSINAFSVRILVLRFQFHGS